MGAHAFHKKNPTENAGDEHQHFRGEYFTKRRHASPLALMTEADAERKCLLSQCANRPLGQLCNLGNRCSRLRVRAQLLYLGLGIFATHDTFLFRFLGHLLLPIFRSAFLAHTNMLASYLLKLVFQPVRNS